MESSTEQSLVDAERFQVKPQVLRLKMLGCRCLGVLVLPDGVVENDSRFHNLTAVAHALANNGLRVTLGPASMFTERIRHGDALTMFSVRSVHSCILMLIVHA